ncbi:MAG: glycosyltransferase, partial [Bdellovibrionia bacterium]
QKSFSDIQISPKLLSGPLSKTRATLNCDSLVREGFSALAPPVSLERALVIASGSGMGISRETVGRLALCPSVRKIFVAGIEGASNGKIIFLGKSKEMLSIMAETDFVVTNGGFSALSEAVVGRRPLIVIPIPGHYEQTHNARTVELAGLGVVSCNENLSDGVEKLIRLFKDHQDRFRTVRAPAEGANIAAQVLVNLGVRSELVRGN